MLINQNYPRMKNGLALFPLKKKTAKEKAT